MTVPTVIQLSVIFSLHYFAPISTLYCAQVADGDVAPDQYRFIVAIDVLFKDNNVWTGIRLTGTLVQNKNKFAVVSAAHMIGRNDAERLLAAKPLNNNFMKFSRPMIIRYGSNIALLQHKMTLAEDSRISIFPRSFMDMDGHNYTNVQEDIRFDVVFIPIFPSEAKEILKGKGEFLDWSNLPSYRDYMKIDNCKIVTFGTTAVNVTAQVLHYADLQPIPVDKCETSRYTKIMWKSHFDQYKYVCHRTLFTARPKLPTVMPGDSGSPVMCSIGGRSQLLFICSGAFHQQENSYIRSVDSNVIFDYYRLAMQLF